MTNGVPQGINYRMIDFGNKELGEDKTKTGIYNDGLSLAELKAMDGLGIDGKVDGIITQAEFKAAGGDPHEWSRYFNQSSDSNDTSSLGAYQKASLAVDLSSFELTGLKASQIVVTQQTIDNNGKMTVIFKDTDSGRTFKAEQSKDYKFSNISELKTSKYGIAGGVTTGLDSDGRLTSINDAANKGFYNISNISYSGDSAELSWGGKTYKCEKFETVNGAKVYKFKSKDDKKNAFELTIRADGTQHIAHRNKDEGGQITNAVEIRNDGVADTMEEYRNVSYGSNPKKK